MYGQATAGRRCYAPLKLLMGSSKGGAMTTTTRSAECTAMPATLFLALELGSTRWKLAFAVTRARRPRLRTIAAGDLAALWHEIAIAKERFALEAAAPVWSCYEAGREAFWLHRALTAHDLSNVVVDPSSIAVDRRQRRIKTDRIDASKLVVQLMNAAAGDRRGLAGGPRAVDRGGSGSPPAAGMGNRP
jgi:transposase